MTNLEFSVGFDVGTLETVSAGGGGGVAGSSTAGRGGNDFDNDARAGLDVKYGVTPSLTLDVTVKPDFAQAEADEQQVNLTQFSLFYPEKREFFLENSGMFYFGDIPRE